MSRQSLAHFPFSPAKCPVFYGWPIVAVGALGVLMSVPGQTVGVSVFADPLMKALGLTRSQLSLAYMLGTIGSACLLPSAGRLCDRLGARITAFIASIALALVLLFMSRSDVLAAHAADFFGLAAPTSAFALIVVGFFGLRFWGQGILTLASYNMMARWFDRKRGLASGLSGVCISLGFSIAPLAFDVLIRQFGWRGAWVALAAMIGGGFALLAFALYRNDPEECSLRTDGDTAPAESDDREIVVSEPSWSRSEAIRTGAFWTLSLSLGLLGLYMTGLTFHLVSIFGEAGMERSQAVMIFLPASGIAMLTHLVGGWLSDRMPLNRLLVVMLAGMGLSTAGLAFLRAGAPVAMVIGGNGVASGLFGLLSGVAWAKYFGRLHLGAICGLHMSLNVFLSACGPFLFSQSFAWSGSYRPAALICSVGVAVLLLRAVRTGPPTRSGSSAQRTHH